MPRASSARCNAAVPELTATACGTPHLAATSASNASTAGPAGATQPERSASTRYCSSRSPTSGEDSRIRSVIVGVAFGYRCRALERGCAVFEVLFVCHANLCRSPLAERLARHALDRAFGVAAGAVGVSSAGTHAYAGTPMHRDSAAVLAEREIGGDDFCSRTVNGSLLGAADLVL